MNHYEVLCSCGKTKDITEKVGEVVKDRDRQWVKCIREWNMEGIILECIIEEMRQK